MGNYGPIVIVEDDLDDKTILEEILRELKLSNKILWFNNCLDAFHYLKTTPDEPFIIFSDINLPKQNGIEFKKQIDADTKIRKKSIPFVFYSTAANQKTVNEAYTEMTVQGFFQKGTSIEEIREQIQIIVNYWQICRHPNY